MTPWQLYISRLDPTPRAEAIRWYKSRPPEIRALCRRFPPGTTAEIDGRTAWLVGFSETADKPGFLFSFANPYEDYDRAVAEQFFVCGDHELAMPAGSEAAAKGMERKARGRRNKL